MTSHAQNADFPERSDENRRIWDANARWWDDQIGDGNDFQTVLIEPATERLLDVARGDRILDVACGAGRFARRMAALGASVVAFDASTEFIARARERTSSAEAIEYHVLDAANVDVLAPNGASRFDKAVSTMALMDTPEMRPLFGALPRVLTTDGVFVFSVTRPCFHWAAIQRFTELSEEEAGRHVVRRTPGLGVSFAGKPGSSMPSTTKPASNPAWKRALIERWKNHCASGCPMMPSVFLANGDS